MSRIVTRIIDSYKECPYRSKFYSENSVIYICAKDMENSPLSLKVCETKDWEQFPCNCDLEIVEEKPEKKSKICLNCANWKEIYPDNVGICFINKKWTMQSYKCICWKEKPEEVENEYNE